MSKVMRWIALMGTASACGIAGAGDCQAPGAVAEADSAVARAREQRALWTTAAEALRQAHRALNGGDCAAAMEFADLARKHAALGLDQKTYAAVK